MVVLGWDPADTHTTNFWEELDSSNGDGSGGFSTGTFTAKKYLWVQAFLDGPSADGEIGVNGDTGSNYSHRRSFNGGSDSTVTSNGNWSAEGGTDTPILLNMFFIHNSANEKLGIVHSIRSETAGAGTAPSRKEWVCKWSNTSSQITSFDFNLTSGSFSTASTVKVWGSD